MNARSDRCASTAERGWVRVVRCAILLAGCARSHERDATSGARDAGRDLVDAGPRILSDAGDASFVRDATIAPIDAGLDAFEPVDAIQRYAERRCAWSARCSSWEIDAAWLRGEASCVHATRRRAEEILDRILAVLAAGTTPRRRRRA